MNNAYYYYPPKNPQFYFEANGFNLLKKYYLPYSLKSKVFWFLYKNSSVIRNRFIVNEAKIPLPTYLVKKLINQENSVFFLNTGTKGEEQKATIIALSKNQKTFLKFAKTKLAMALVDNEAKALLKLEKSNIPTARLIKYGVENEYAFILTEVINGRKVNLTSMNEELINLVLEVNNSFPINHNEQIEVFSHGDFCPWNMLMTSDNKLVLVDWEKAGYKPLGYDLFTFIFQTSFLINPNNTVANIIKRNNQFIEDYFNKYKIKNWKFYLIIFAKLKVEEESSKTNNSLLNKYKLLSTHNGKN